MGDLIGMRVSTETPHPQEFVDALYREIIDNYPADEEVDLFVAVDGRDHEDDHFFIVKDIAVARAGHTLFMGTDHKVGIVARNSMLKAGDAWARNVPDADGYIFLHKHPEGFAIPSPKDHGVRDALTAIDWVRGDHRTRNFVLMMILNRNASGKLAPGDYPMLINDLEIDLPVEAHLWENMIEDMDQSHPKWDELVAIHDQMRAFVVKRQEFVDNDDQDGFNRVVDEHKSLQERMYELLDEIDPDNAPYKPEPLPDLDELIRRITGVLGVDPGQVNMLPGSTAREGGFTISMQGGLNQPPSIDGPVDAADAIMRGFGFTPPPVAPAADDNEPDDEPVDEGRPPVPEVFDLPDVQWLD